MSTQVKRSRTIRVLVVDAQRLFAELLMHMLDADERIEVVGHAENGVHGVRLALSLQPDVVLMDVALPKLDGIEATQKIHEELKSTCVLILTGSDSPEVNERALQAGAVGYITKDANCVDLMDAIVGIASLAVALKSNAA